MWAGPDSGGCQVPALVVPLPPACPWRHPSGPGAPCPAPRSRAGGHHPGFGLHCRPGWRGAHHPPPLCPVSWHKACRCCVTPSLPSDPCTPACRGVRHSGEGTLGLPFESWLPSLWHSRPSLEGSRSSTRVLSSERPTFLQLLSCGPLPLLCGPMLVVRHSREGLGWVDMPGWTGGAHSSGPACLKAQVLLHRPPALMRPGPGAAHWLVSAPSAPRLPGGPGRGLPLTPPSSNRLAGSGGRWGPHHRGIRRWGHWEDPPLTHPPPATRLQDPV